jgi:hypothetical protein
VNTATTTSPDEIGIADAWAYVECALYDHFYQPDIDAARAFYASIAAHDLPGQPVWLMLVAAPGSGKTELLNPLHGQPNTHLIDSLTPNTLISGRAPEPGKPKGKDGLLERIGTSAVICFPDFSTVLEGNRDKRGEIFAQLRRLYDGRLRREFGIDHGAGVTEWAGRLTICAAVTPEVDRYTSVFGALGERFVMIRWKRIGGVEGALAAMHQDQPAKNAAMREAVGRLFTLIKDAPIPKIPTDIERAIAATAEIVARGRTAVRRERNDDVEYSPEPESATRLAQQLCQLAKGSARLEGRAVVTDDDLAIVHRVAYDTLPPHRAVILRAILKGQSAEKVDLPRTTRRRAIEDLEHVGLITAAHRLTPEVQGLFRLARLLPM